MRQAFGLLVACLALATAGCANIGGSAFNGNDTTTVPDTILVTPGTGNGIIPTLALQSGQFLLLSAQALKGGLNMTLPSNAFTWDASYAGPPTKYTNVLDAANPTKVCPAAPPAATTVPASFSLATPTNTVTAGGSTFTTYTTGTTTNTIDVIPLIAGLLPTGLPAGMTTAPPSSGYCEIVNAHYLGQTGSIVVFVGNSP